MINSKPPTILTPSWRLRLFAGLGLLGIVIGGAIASQFSGQTLGKSVATALASINTAGETGWVIFLAVQTIVVISGILPASTVGVAAGLAYGLLVGSLLAATSVLAGAFVSFALARSLARPLITRLLTRWVRLRRFDDLVARDGWKLVCLVRVSPIMPFAVTSYGLGLTSISPGKYLIGTLGSLPALFAYVLIGRLTHVGFSAWSGDTALLRVALIGSSIVATLLLTVYISRIVARSGRFPHQALTTDGAEIEPPAQGNDTGNGHSSPSAS